jgi:hypothetical protein
LSDQRFRAGSFFLEPLDCRLGRFKLCARGGLGSFAQPNLSLDLGVFFLKALDVVGLPQVFGP